MFLALSVLEVFLAAIAKTDALTIPITSVCGLNTRLEYAY
ncbi:hypothetical protein DSBG_0076 [Desulfosporosinus sp. BG]|nr:hypothetical protein DSBG_0076 [Desulfosporosinus sp. BG]